MGAEFADYVEGAWVGIVSMRDFCICWLGCQFERVLYLSAGFLSGKVGL